VITVRPKRTPPTGPPAAGFRLASPTRIWAPWGKSVAYPGREMSGRRWGFRRRNNRIFITRCDPGRLDLRSAGSRLFASRDLRKTCLGQPAFPQLHLRFLEARKAIVRAQGGQFAQNAFEGPEPTQVIRPASDWGRGRQAWLNKARPVRAQALTHTLD
jgi:hypothetical protein